MSNLLRMLAVLTLLAFTLATPPGAAAACADLPAATAQSGHGAHVDDATPVTDDEHGDAHGTPATTDMPFDLAYIDMMIPHHESVIALAEVAVDELEDDRLVAIAEGIIMSQQAENAELYALRDAFYRDAETVPMDAMMAALPGMVDSELADDMAMLMDAEALIATFCGADDRDLAFIDLVIPHHQMAIDASEGGAEVAEHDEILTIAERVIAEQEAEIAELDDIRADLAA